MQYTTINHTARKRLELTIFEYMVLDSIKNLSGTYEYPVCTSSNEQIAEFIGSTAKTVQRAKKVGINKGLIVKKGIGYIATQKWVNETQLDKMSTPTGQNVQVELDKMSTNKEIDIKIINISDKVANENIIKVLDEFKKWNPAIKSMYGNKTQRKACKDLIDTYGIDKVILAIQVLPSKNKEKYGKKSFTPYDLWNNWAFYQIRTEPNQNYKLNEKPEYTRYSDGFTKVSKLIL